MALTVLGLAGCGGCGRESNTGTAGTGDATPPAGGVQEPAETGVEYQIVAQGGAGLGVEVDGEPAGVLDGNDQLTLTLQPRDACYEIRVRLNPDKTTGDCYVVEAARTSVESGPGAQPRRQLVLDLLEMPR